MPKSCKYLLKASDMSAALSLACLSGGFALTTAGHAPLWINQGFIAAYASFGACIQLRVLATWMLGRRRVVYIASSPDALRSNQVSREYIRREDLKKEIIKRCRNFTDAERESFLRDSYYGMWIRLSGDVINVMPWTGSYAEVRLRVYSWWHVDANLKFYNELFYRNHLKAIRKSKSVTVVGRIVKITPNEIFVDTCDALSA